MCVCVRACVCACVRECVCACVFITLLINCVGILISLLIPICWRGMLITGVATYVIVMRMSNSYVAAFL